MKFQKSHRLRGELCIPGDKSISHRAVMFGALATGTTEIDHFLQGADCLSTISCFRQMGITIEEKQIGENKRILVHGRGLHGLKQPTDILDVGNSGTTIRLMSGILSGQPFPTRITGDLSIQKRPMKRIIAPLTQMGARITSKDERGFAPLLIEPATICDTQKPNNTTYNQLAHTPASPILPQLKGIHYVSPVASAQVKTSILLAGLYANSSTSITEPYVSRNHSELMLTSFGADISTKNTCVTITPKPKLVSQHITVPGDISSAAYFIAAALIIPNSEIVIKNVGINPTRDGILRVCESMGAKIIYENVHKASGEPICDLIVSSQPLHGVTIEGSIIPTLIDEIPIIAVLACFAKGTTIIKDASELKVKESNRIDVVVSNLAAMGADITATEDGMIIHGGNTLQDGVIDTKSDHRIAMSFAIAGLASEGITTLLHGDCVDISYPDFYHHLETLQL